jgi:hypothetical protein
VSTLFLLCAAPGGAFGAGVLMMDAVKYFFIALRKLARILVELRTGNIGRRHAVEFPVHHNMIPAFAAGDVLFFDRHKVNFGFWNLDFGFFLLLRN